ncbi:hypothetical protein K439DRAFT_873923 [Ramaria rubella]|nr:hypothetical protein K439DRAFT_873923 [Ramaria rubella]
MVPVGVIIWLSPCALVKTGHNVRRGVGRRFKKLGSWTWNWALRRSRLGHCSQDDVRARRICISIVQMILTSLTLKTHYFKL